MSERSRRVMTNWALGILLLLCAAGMGVAGVLALLELQLAGTGAVCGAVGCNRVLASEYARVGGVPAALMGVAFYAVFLCAGSVAASLPPEAGRRRIVYATAGWSIIGALVSAVLMILQAAVIRAFCPLCTTSAAISLALLLLSIWLARRWREWQAQPVILVLPVVGLAALAATGVWLRRAAPPPTEVLARVGGEPITRADLEKDLGGRLRAMEWQTYRITKDWVDQRVADVVVKREAAERKITPAELVEAEVNGPVRKRVEEHLAKNAAGLPKEDLPGVRERVRMQFKGERAEAFVEGLKRKYNVTSFIRPPEIREEDLQPHLGWKRGPDDAPVRLVIFSDFACPYCAELAGNIEKVMAAYPGRVSVVYRYLTMDEHYRSDESAIAAECAGQLGKFWEYHDQLMQRSGKLGGVNFIEFATGVGLDEKKFRACLEAEFAADRVRKSVNQARTIGIETTPAVFLNGKRIGGMVGYEELANRVGELLNR